MRKADLQQQAVELIKQLSTEKLKAGIDYLNYLQDKEAWAATHELAKRSRNRQEFRDRNRRTKIQLHNASLKLLKNLMMLHLEDAEALLQVIKENQMPVRFDSPFAANEQESQ